MHMSVPWTKGLRNRPHTWMRSTADETLVSVGPPLHGPNGSNVIMVAFPTRHLLCLHHYACRSHDANEANMCITCIQTVVLWSLMTLLNAKAVRGIMCLAAVFTSLYLTPSLFTHNVATLNCLEQTNTLTHIAFKMQNRNGLLRITSQKLNQNHN